MRTTHDPSVGLIGLDFIAVAIILIAAFGKNKRPSQMTEEDRRRIAFDFEKPQLNLIINESLEIILKTKNVDTGISRFETIRRNITRLIDIAPQSAQLKITINDSVFQTHEDLSKIDKIKSEWVRTFFINKIDGELKKAAALSDYKLQKA